MRAKKKKKSSWTIWKSSLLPQLGLAYNNSHSSVVIKVLEISSAFRGEPFPCRMSRMEGQFFHSRMPRILALYQDEELWRHKYSVELNHSIPKTNYISMKRPTGHHIRPTIPGISHTQPEPRPNTAAIPDIINRGLLMDLSMIITSETLAHGSAMVILALLTLQKHHRSPYNFTL